MKIPVWQTQFSKEFTHASAGFSASISEPTLLSHALKSGALNENEYFAWAQNHWEIPLLKSNFDRDFKVDLAIWYNWQKQFPFNSVCLPIAEWEGKVYVACLEVPTEGQWQGCIFVLARPSSLRKVAEFYQMVHSPQTAAKNDAPEGLDFGSLNISPATDDDPMASLQKSVLNQKSNESPDLSSMTNVAFDKTAIFSRPAGQNTEIPAPPLLEENSGLNIDAAPPSLSLNKSEAPKAHNPKNEKPMELTASQAFTDNDLTGSSAFKIVEQSNSLKAFDSTQSVTPAGQGSPKVAAPTHAPSEPAKSGAATKEWLAAIQSLSPKQFASASVDLMNGIKQHFDGGFLLSYNIDSNTLRPFLKDDGSAVKTTVGVVKLGSPSLFNIVHATTKPYHGYIVSNDTNDQFFEEVTAGHIPDHVTVVPIMGPKGFMGAVMAMSSSPKGLSELHQVESLVERFKAAILASGAA